MLALTLHENSLLTIYRDREVAVRLHPGRDVLVPSTCSLLAVSGTIDAFEKLQTMTELCDAYHCQDLQKVQEILCKDTVNDEDEDIVISEKARAIKGEAEFFFSERSFLLQQKPNQLSATDERQLRSLPRLRIAQIANPRQSRSRRPKEGLP